MVHCIWRLERRLQEGCLSNHSTWPPGNKAPRLGLCVLLLLFRSLQTGVSQRAISPFPNHSQSPHLAILNSRALCKEEEHLYLEVHPLPQLLCGLVMGCFQALHQLWRPGSDAGRGVHMGQSTQQCLPRAHTFPGCWFGCP